MALLQNCFLQNQLPLKHLDGVQGKSIHNYANADRLNQSSRFGALAATPTASYPPTAWVLPRTAGAIASRTGIAGGGAVGSLNLAGGLNSVAPLNGSGDITQANVLYVIIASAALTSSGDAIANLGGALEAHADLTASGEATGTLASLVSLLADLSGSGDLAGSIEAIQVAEMISALVGAGDLSGELSGALQALANLVTSGELTADVSGRMQAIAALVGSGAVTQADAELAWAMAASLLGESQFASAINAIGEAIADLTATGEVEATPSALASIGAAVVVTGDMVSAQSIAEALKPDLAVINRGVQNASKLIPHDEDV